MLKPVFGFLILRQTRSIYRSNFFGRH